MSNKIYRFDEYSFDPQRKVLVKNNEPVPLESKVASTLMFLIENQGKVVSKEELIGAVWNKSVVEDNGLRRNISVLRSTLDRSHPNRYIETIPREGYRFCGNVALARSPETSEVNATSHTDSTRKSTALIRQTSPSTHSSRLHRTMLESSKHWRWALAAIALLSAWPISVLISHARKWEYSSIQLTNNSVELPINAAAISPDGSMLAYSDSSGIYIKHLNRGNTVDKLPVPPTIDPSRIQWYRDQVHLLLSAYDASTQQLSAWKASTNGATNIAVENSSGVNLSSDGERIVYFRKDHQLWMANNDGSHPTLLLTLKPGFTFEYTPKFSADGGHILYSKSTSEKSSNANESIYPSIEMLSLNSLQTKVLYAPKKFIMDFALSANGTLFVSQLSNDTANDSDIVAMKIDVDSKSQSAIHKIVSFPGKYANRFSLSDHGEMALIGNVRQSDIYIADLKDSNTAISNLRRISYDDAHDRPFSWLHDGKTVLFYSDRTGNFGIYKQNINDIIATPQVIEQQLDATWPVVSPDQQWLYYFTSDPANYEWNAPTTLMRKSLINGTTESLGMKNDLSRAIRCAEKTCVIAEQSSTDRAFYEFDPATGKQTRELARVRWNDNSNTDWSLSPDGKRIAYVDQLNAHSGIGVIDITPPPVFSSVHVNTDDQLKSVSWNAQGNGFFVTTSGSDFETLRLSHVNMNGETHELLLNPNNRRSWAIPSPDGKHLAIHKYTQHANVWLLKAKYQ